MDRRDAAALDRYITGNYGEDQIDQEPMSLLDAALLLSDALHKWEAEGAVLPAHVDYAWSELTAAIEDERKTSHEQLES